MSLITTPFDATSTAQEAVAGTDLSGRRVVVTGASSGIGVETARALAGAGAQVVLAVRDTGAGERVAADLRATTGRSAADVAVRHLDLTDRASVTAFAAAWDGPLDVLVNNAGVMAVQERRLTADGWELQLATNHLGHLLLALGLHDALAADGGGRVVSVSSSGHRASPVVLEDLMFERRPYDPWAAYGQAKTANVLFAVEATRRWAAEGITANALMPGGIMTNLQKHVPQEVKDGWVAATERGDLTFKTTQQGAMTSVLLAASPLLDGVGGRYFEDGQEQPVVAEDSDDAGVRAWAVDPVVAERLWDVSVALLAQPLPG